MSEGLTTNQLAERNALLVTENAVLQQKLDALAAENAALKQWASETDELWINGCDLDAHLDELPQTPATDAYLNSVRADAIVEAASRISAQVWEEDEGAGMVAAVNALAIIEQELRAG